MIRETGDADADADLGKGIAVQFQIHQGDSPPDAIRHSECLPGGGFRECREELLAAPPAAEVKGALHRAVDDPGSPLEHTVPGEVAVGVVEVLESVDVHEEKGDRMAASQGVAPEPLELPLQRASVPVLGHVIDGGIQGGFLHPEGLSKEKQKKSADDQQGEQENPQQMRAFPQGMLQDEGFGHSGRGGQAEGRILHIGDPG